MSNLRELRAQLLTTAELYVQGRDANSLQRRCKAGTLVRVRHGVYKERAAWDAFDQWDRYRLQILAVNLSAASPPLFSHESAAVINSVPVLGVPHMVHTQQEGARSARTRKDVRRHFATGYVPEKVRVDGLRLTALDDTLVALASESSFASAVVAFDSALSGKRTDAARIRDASGWLPTDAARRRLDTVLDFSSPLSGSPGESASRANLHQFGFPAPQLQASFHDSRGFVARTDFYWAERNLIGEFDGLVKYQKPEYMGGRTASQTVIEEKKREDRLRALGLSVVRWLWEDVNQPERLRGLLLAQGLTAGSPIRPPRREPAGAAETRRRT